MDSAPRNPVTAVIVVAAGSGQRLGYGMPKAKVPLGGDSILTHALRGVAAAGIAGQICVAIPPGDPELHAWITLLGMVGDTKMEQLAYEPFFRAIMAMGVAYWDLEPAMAR